METIHIALPSDQNYVIGLAVTAGSIAHHASRDVKLMFHVLDGGIREDTFADMAQKVKRLHPNVEFHRIAVNEDMFRNYPVWSGNKMTYARLLLADALPDVSHIIYSDTDFLWLIDIAELWAQRSDEVIFMSVRDLDETIAIEEKWAADHNLPFDGNNYFCAGLSFYNLNKFREEGIIAKVAEFINAHKDIQLADQTALYHVLHNRIITLPQKWQTFSSVINKEKLLQPVAIHYAGDTPWRLGRFWPLLLSDGAILWYAMLDYINGAKPGTSIKSHLTVWQRIYKRALANAYHHNITRGLFKFALKSTGRGPYISYFFKFVIDFHISVKKIRERATTRISL